MKKIILGILFAIMLVPTANALEITEPENYGGYFDYIALMGVVPPTIKWTDDIQSDFYEICFKRDGFTEWHPLYGLLEYPGMDLCLTLPGTVKQIQVPMWMWKNKLPDGIYDITLTNFVEHTEKQIGKKTLPHTFLSVNGVNMVQCDEHWAEYCPFGNNPFRLYWNKWINTPYWFWSDIPDTTGFKLTLRNRDSSFYIERTQTEWYFDFTQEIIEAMPKGTYEYCVYSMYNDIVFNQHPYWRPNCYWFIKE